MTDPITDAMDTSDTIDAMDAMDVDTPVVPDSESTAAPATKPTKQQPQAKPFATAAEITAALDTDHKELLHAALGRVRAHFALLSHPENDAFTPALRVAVEYLDSKPDYAAFWKGMEWTTTHFPLMHSVYPALEALLTAPIPLPTHRAPLFRALLTRFAPQLLTILQRATPRNAHTVACVLRILAAGAANDCIGDLVAAELLRPYIHLARLGASTSGPTSGHGPKKKGGKDAASTSKAQVRAVRSAYMHFMGTVLANADGRVRTRLVEDRRFVAPLLAADLDHDDPAVLQPWLAAVTAVLDDPRVTRTAKVALFPRETMDALRRLYSAPADLTREIGHAFLMYLCTVPGRGVCFRHNGVYPASSNTKSASITDNDNSTSNGEAAQSAAVVAAKMPNRLLAQFALKLDTTDPRQLALLQTMCAACPEVLAYYMHHVSLSLDPRPSPKWVANATHISAMLAVPMPSLADPQQRPRDATSSDDDSVYPVHPPAMSALAPHILPTPPLARAHFNRGLAMPSPVVQFFTLRLLMAALEKLVAADAALARAAEWWMPRDTAVAARWAAARTDLRTHVGREAAEWAGVERALWAAHAAVVAAPSAADAPYDLDALVTSGGGKAMDADARALEEAEGVTPGMVYVCAVRVVAGYARLLPQFMAASLDTGRLAAPLPPRDLVPDLIDLLAARPPPLAPKTLATLLQVHAAQTLPEQSARVLTAMLARASVFDGCEHEVQWWIKGVPASASVIVALTNLVGMAIKSLYSMLDLVVESMDDDQSMDMDTHGEEDDEQIPPLPFSPLAAALVVTLSDPTAHALDPPAVKFLLTVLARIHASLPDPAPLERLLASRGLNLADLPDLDVVLMGEPALMVAKALQPLSHGGDIPLAFAAVATIVGEQPDAQTKQAATLATVGHPRFASIVARDPEEAAAFVVQVAPILLRDKTRESELVAPVLAAFKAALTTEAAEPAHFTATTTVYKELSALLDLQSVPVDAFAPESWLVLLPVLAHVPASVSQSLFASTQVTALLVEVMRNALLPNFPLPGSVTAADDKLSARTAVRDGTSALDMEMVPVTVVDRVASLRPTTAAATDVLTILAAYSPLHFERLLSLLEAAAPATEPKKAMPNPHYAALIRATAVAETRAPYQVKWRCDDEARERVLRVITKATGLVAADDMVVAAVAMDAHLAQQQRTGDDGSDDENDEEENSRSPRRLALNLPSAVAAWRWAVASGDEHVCAYAKEAARLVANALARGESVPAPALLRLFVYATQQAVDEGVMLPGTLDVVEFSTALVSAKQSQRAAVQYFASWLPQMRTELTPVLLGRVLASVMAVASGTSVAGDARVKLLKCAESIMRTAPSRFCLQEYLLALLSMYRASLHPRDQAILRILHLYESRAATNLGQMMMFWGEASATAPAGGAAQRTFDESIALIDPERMARTVRYFPIHLELALPTRADDGEDEEAAATTTTVLPDAAYLYDPRFMLPLTLKYLEQGNGLDLRYFLDRNLVALGVAALGSQHASMRRAGLAILDEYYTLIVTSKLKNKPIVYATLDLLRHQITSRDPENPTRLPVLITTFVGQAMTLLIHPEYDAYEPVQLALLSRPFLDLDGVPGVQDMLTASANGRHRAWMLGLLHAGARSARDVTTILMRHVLDNLQAYAASHAGVLGAAMGASGAQARGMLHVALHICVQSTRAERAFGDAELASASERAVYGTGLLPFLQHQVEGLGLATTASHRDATAHTPATLLLAVARAMAVLKARTAVQQSHAATIAASCLSTLATIATTTANDSPSMSPALWLNMLDAVAAVAPTVPAVQATAHWALSEIETVTPANKLVAWAQLPASDAARVLSIEARVVLAPEGHLMDALERVDSNVGDLYRSVTRRLAPHCRSMRKRAIAVLGDTDVFIS